MMIDGQRTNTLGVIRNVVCVLKNSTVLPFSWHLNKYKCFFCIAGFVDHSDIRQHMRKEHSAPNLDLVVKHHLISRQAANVKVDLSDITCKLCAQNIITLDSLVQHLIEKHKINYDRNVECKLQGFYLSELKCSKCNEKFEFFQTLLHHSNRHSAPWLCHDCGSSFSNKALMRQHILRTHLAVKKVYQRKCRHCPERFKTPHLRWSHMAAAHDLKVDYKCEQCGMGFHIKSRLTRHVRATHLKERNFACEVCGDRFFNSNLLKLHKVRHSQARPFECEVCKKEFARKKNLDIHVRIHTDDRRCVCKLCGKKFIQTASLKLHLRVHHANK